MAGCFIAAPWAPTGKATALASTAVSASSRELREMRFIWGLLWVANGRMPLALRPVHSKALTNLLRGGPYEAADTERVPAGASER